MMRAIPYFGLGSRSAEALDFYTKHLDAKAVDVYYFTPEIAQQRGMKTSDVMHAMLDLNGALIQMSASSPENITGATVLELEPGPESTKRFESMFATLSDGGKIHVPFAKQFWGGIYGFLTDKFGVSWQFHIAEGAPQKD